MFIGLCEETMYMNERKITSYEVIDLDKKKGVLYAGLQPKASREAQAKPVGAVYIRVKSRTCKFKGPSKGSCRNPPQFLGYVG